MFSRGRADEEVRRRAAFGVFAVLGAARERSSRVPDMRLSTLQKKPLVPLNTNTLITTLFAIGGS